MRYYLPASLFMEQPANAMRRAQLLLWSVMALLCAAIGLVSYRYLLFVGPLPPIIVGNTLLAPWLAVHVAAAATALILGPIQFLPGVRARYSTLHRWLGRTYVVACSIGGVAGFMLALGASTGWISTTGFGLLAITWTTTTALAWRSATQRNFAEHRAWMLRSFALTFAAVTLRLYLPVAALLPVSFEDAYRAISFLAWVPNLIVAEVYLRAAKKEAPGSAGAKSSLM